MWSSSLVVDDSGTIYVAYSCGEMICLSKSINDGNSFENICSIKAGVTLWGFPKLSIDKKDTLFLVWSDFMWRSSSNIYLTKSIDGGETFSQIVSISEENYNEFNNNYHCDFIF